MPLAIPVDVLIEAIPELLLVHAPLPTESVNVVVNPVQNLVTPEIADGIAFTVNACVAGLPQPVE